MSTNHPYLKYAQALLMSENNLSSSEEITPDIIVSEIEKGLETFRVQPIKKFQGKEKVEYGFVKTEKGNVPKGIFLSPNIVVTDKLAKNIWNEANNLLKILGMDNTGKMGELKMSIAPTAGEYLSFSPKNTIGRGKPKVSILYQGMSAITTLTQYKPSMQYRIDKKSRPELYNVCLIPDLPINDLKNFIQFFKRMLKSQTSANLMFGNIVPMKKVKGGEEIIIFEPKRPLIFKGNFPNPPRSSALGGIALLGAIGEFTKASEYSEQAKRVLESLKSATMYMIKYGGAQTFTYNHHVIEIAKEGKLKTIIDSLYYSKLYNRGKRTKQNTTEYQKFDLFTSRFLLLFNSSSFKDFLSFRAEYPNPVKILFNIYFNKMEKIDSRIVTSAKALGKWLNKVAYFFAKAEVKKDSPNYWEELRKAKSKVLVELESSTFSSKTGDALIAQAVIRAGRLSGMDAPQAASLFMEKTASGDLPLAKAKNLLIAFSRLTNTDEKNLITKDETKNEEIEEVDLSNE